MQNLPLIPSFDSFEEKASKGNLIPVYAELSADYETPISVYQKICDGQFSFLLESAESTDRAGRFSFIGSDPRSVIEARGPNIKISKGNEVDEFQLLILKLWMFQFCGEECMSVLWRTQED